MIIKKFKKIKLEILEITKPNMMKLISKIWSIRNLSKKWKISIWNNSCLKISIVLLHKKYKIILLRHHNLTILDYLSSYNLKIKNISSSHLKLPPSILTNLVGICTSNHLHLISSSTLFSGFLSNRPRFILPFLLLGLRVKWDFICWEFEEPPVKFLLL